MFWLRYINLEAFDLVDAEIRLYLQKPLFDSGDNHYDTALHVVHGSRIEEDIPPARLMALKTESDGKRYIHADPHTRQLYKLSPPHLRPTNKATNYTPKIIVAINGVSTGTSNRFSVRKAYSIDDVICGRFSKGVDNVDYVDLGRRAKLKKFASIFDEVTLTIPERCDTCDHRSKCPLRFASRGPEIKYINSIGYFTGAVEYTTIHTDWKKPEQE